ncbi:hypothetical protein ACKI2N_030405 [Cupriavidus sp. 30B13]|uniref:hypothetical protein n=1 Tax=Cupriavidus sp. 30B13 TaxID=3384241 RepID=UPI003B90A827
MPPTRPEPAVPLTPPIAPIPLTQPAGLRAAHPPRAGAATATGAHGRLALPVMLCGTFMVVMDFFIVNVALPAIQRELHASAGALQCALNRRCGPAL